MEKVKTGNFTYTYFFTLKEKELYDKYKIKYNGYYKERFIDNGYCLEITKIKSR